MGRNRFDYAEELSDLLKKRIVKNPELLSDQAGNVVHQTLAAMDRLQSWNEMRTEAASLLDRTTPAL